MAPSHIPLWIFFSSTIAPKPPRNILHLFSQLKFDGEGETIASQHDFKFFEFYYFHNITNGNIICRLFTLTFTCWVKSWCETLLAASNHTWE
jgi:hypothetical protein